MGRRLNREDLGVRDSPATKRKVFEMDPKSLTGREFLTSLQDHPMLKTSSRYLMNFEIVVYSQMLSFVWKKRISCYRAVLSACSSYFRAMFCNDHRESREMLVEINGILASYGMFFTVCLYWEKWRSLQRMYSISLKHQALFSD